ncbi:hypothetical protein ACH40F_09225 [Streptomyces sp. NPDC020794]|uniref:rhamnogalacturonan lyase family protein n=1 Tax=unclassified Streptomyces TaxID=2593676 RepID=UPI0036ECD383
MRPRRLGVTAAAALLAGLVAAPSHATEQHPPPRRIVERLDRGLVAVPSGKGTFLSWRLLGTECALPQVLGSARTGGTPTGDAIAFNVYKGGRRLNRAPVIRSTTYQDGSRGTGTYTVRAVVNGHEQKPSSAALDFAKGYAEIPLAAVDAPAAISGSTAIGGYRNDDNVTVYDLDGDGRAEVLVHTADGTTFADGAKVTADSPANQFISVIDGETGLERTRQPVPDDLVAGGPSGGHFGIAYLDGVHPSLVTKLVTRVGAKRGAFRILFQTWDFNGTDLKRRWKYVVPAGSGATSFHQIRTVDVDQDGKDEIADGNYVVGGDGTLRYVVDGAGHGDRFDIAGLDVGRGSAADIVPGHPGYEYWTSTADVTRPGAGVFNVRDGKISTTTPSVNFRIWWDGDKGAELLDYTHVDKWDPKTETSTRLFDPAGVVSGARNATPFYGDLLGDWREEILAETGDDTALRLYTTTEPTRTRIYTLAQNPGYRLGWTARGYLQSTYTDYYLGTETRRVPKPAITTAARTEGTS